MSFSYNFNNVVSLGGTNANGVNLSNYNPGVGEPAGAWTYIAGNLFTCQNVVTAAGRVRMTSGNAVAESLAISPYTPQSVDYAVTCVMEYFDDTYICGPAIRCGPDTCYGVSYSRFNGWSILRKDAFAAGTRITEYQLDVFGNPILPMDTGANSQRTVTLSIVGTTLTLTIDGTLLLTATDTTYTAAGSSGIWGLNFFVNTPSTDSTGIQITSFSVTEPISEPTPTTSSVTQTTLTVNGAAALNAIGTVDYQYQRAPDSSGSSGTYANVGTLRSGVANGVNPSVLNDNGLTQNTAYWYRVVATDSGSNVATSSGVQVTTVSSSPPAQVTGLTASAATSTSVVLNWTQPSGSPTQNKIYKGTSSGSETLLATISATTTYTATGLTSGTIYFFKVSAVNGNGEGTLSSEVSATPGIPLTPINVTASANDDYGVNLIWDRVGTGETGFVIQRKLGAGAFATVATIGPGENIWQDNSTYENTAYTYQIKATYSTNSSTAFSSPAGVTTIAYYGGLSGVQPITGLSIGTTDAWTLTASWTNPFAGASFGIQRSSDGGLTFQTILFNTTSSTGANSYVDHYLTPGTTYTYRIRNYANYPDHATWSAPSSGTSSSRPAGVPLESGTVAGSTISGVLSVLTWTDANASAVTWHIETAGFGFFDDNGYFTPSFTEVGTVAGAANPGTTVTYNLATSANTMYYVRVRASNGSGNGGYSTPIIVRSASAGSADTINIGPGKTYISIGAAAAAILAAGPGSTINIYPNKDANGNVIPYFEKLMLSTAGTVSLPVLIQGISDSLTGAKPIIDGTNATTASQFASYYPPNETYGLIIIDRRSTVGRGAAPQYLTLANLEIRNVTNGATFKASDGTTKTYDPSASGVYLPNGIHITIRDCEIHHCCNGSLGHGGRSGGDPDDNEVLMYASYINNYFHDCGVNNSFFQHQLYIEGLFTTIQGNRFGQLLSGSLGASIKCRCVRPIIVANRVESGSHTIDLPESQNYSLTAATMPEYRHTYVMNNEFWNVANGAATAIHYGGDQSSIQNGRQGVLHFYGNTFVNASVNYYGVTILATYVNNQPSTNASSSNAFDARNNIILLVPTNTGINAAVALTVANGSGYLGVNWYSSTGTLGNTTGYVGGTSQIINNGSNDPGLLDTTGGDFRLKATAQVIDRAGALPDSAIAFSPDDKEYAVSSVGWVTHSISGAARDLGAHEYGGVPATPNTPATGYTLLTPDVLILGQQSIFRVTATPNGNVFEGEIITITATGLGSIVFNTTVGATFALGTLVPSSLGTFIFRSTNSGSLSNPADINLLVRYPIASSYSIILPNPAGASLLNNSGYITFSLPSSTTLLSPITLTPVLSGGGTFTPSSPVLNGDNASVTCTVLPLGSTGNRLLSVTNDGGLIDPNSVDFVVVAEKLIVLKKKSLR